MKLKKKKTRWLVLSVCAIICLSLLCCAYTWKWIPDPYEPDHTTQSIYSADGDIVETSTEAFNDFTCFPSENVAELKAEIEIVKKYCDKK